MEPLDELVSDAEGKEKSRWRGGVGSANLWKWQLPLLTLRQGKAMIALKTDSTCTAATEPSTAAYRTPGRGMIDVRHAWPS
eukprot:6177586-Pleurochrysis_carterae.AAC.2